MAEIKADEITSVLRQQIAGFKGGVDVSEEGTIISAGDGIARVYGLENCMAGELLKLPHEVYGMALNLEEESVGAVLFGEFFKVKEGDTVKRTGRIIEVPIGEDLIGRGVNPLGHPLYGKGPLPTTKTGSLDRLAPGVVDRQPVKEPLQTRLRAIDAMMPIGPG